ncbi:PqiB family protein [Gilvimarinus sp. DA14]|uniref:PqiB family protein n=1 Tax=Gilvimarinus sp. DA14 TaxID=2956798 RepID=UPI0020B7F291|nr:MlaD family protein [Gilvimarinus sp. DA14]UTF61295.1 MlaD family protein [Gilvimarinus sp. DA14]
MTNDNEQFDDAIPLHSVDKKRGVSAVWLLPLFAVILGAWLTYKHFTEAGVSIVVTFPTGEGVDAGKTEVRYKGIQIGTVTELDVHPDLQSVAAQIELSKQAETALREDTQFWLVKPELSLGGVQGLDTLVSGNYIAMRPGQSPNARYVFKALEEAPPPELTPGDLEIRLSAPNLGSLHAGSPIHYRKLQVGELVDYALSDDNRSVIFKAHIDAEYAHLLNSNSRFWNTSGVSISGDLNSINVNTDSLASIILGGLSFAEPEGTEPGEPVMDNQVFKIYPSYTEADTGIEIDIQFNTAEGLKANHTEIRYKGLTVGKLKTLDMKDDYSAVNATASINPLADVLLNETTEFWLATPTISLSRISGLSTLLTGSHVEMEFTSEGDTQVREFIALQEPPAPRKDKDGLYLELTAEGLEGITRSSEVYYRNVSIGKVVDYRLNEDQSKVIMDVHIPPKFAPLITQSARFYQNSGVNISADLSGVNINTESLSSILRGGIGLYLPESAKDAPAAENKSRFALHASLAEAKDKGPVIQVSFTDSDGLKKGAELRYLGVAIGEVEDITLNHPEPGITAYIRLRPEAQSLIVQGTEFWRVKPDISLKGINNLGTIVFGQYIAIEPGQGDELTYEFHGRETPPDDYLSENGLSLTLQAPSLASIKEGRSVFYREIPVGEVTGFELAPKAQHVNIYLHIYPSYAPLVRSNTVFWNATGIAFDFGWLSGANLRTGSVQSLLAGGIALATPDLPGEPASDGKVFTLHDAPQSEWKNWTPEIPLRASN